MPRTTITTGSLAAWCLCLAAVARADPPAGFDARVERIRTWI